MAVSGLPPHGPHETDGSTDVTAEVGRRVRFLRKQSGKGLRQAAADLGVSAGTLSMLENGATTISIRRLQSIAQYFGVSVSRLLTAEPGHGTAVGGSEIYRNCLASLPAVSRGKGVTYQVVGGHPGDQLQVAFVSLAPGAGFEVDGISHPGQELIYVLAGTVRLRLGHDSHRLGQGDAVVFDSAITHSLANDSRHGHAMALSVATPPW